MAFDCFRFDKLTFLQILFSCTELRPYKRVCNTIVPGYPGTGYQWQYFSGHVSKMVWYPRLPGYADRRRCCNSFNLLQKKAVANKLYQL
eukprot:2822731-Rhodomonas_salina.2